jgi:hypothetical protein
MQRTFKLDVAPEGRFVTVSDRIYLALDGLPESAVALPVGEGVRPACGAPIKAWELPKELSGTAMACACVTAVIRPTWAPESIVAHWPALLQIRGQAKNESDPRMN